MSIHKLPAETLCKIFILSTQARYPSFTIQTPEMKPIPDNFHTAVSPDVIASICRRWRQIALSDPILWSTLFLSLRGFTDNTVKQARSAVDHCSKRSANLPLSCFVKLDRDPWPKKDKLALRHIINLLFKAEAQKRWRTIYVIFLPMDWKVHSDVGSHLLRLCSEELGLLRDMRIESRIHSITGTSPLLSLTTLELILDEAHQTTGWLTYCPNLESLSILIDNTISHSWLDTVQPITLNRLRYFEVCAPISALQLFNCPVLEDLTLLVWDDEYGGRYFARYHEFLYNNPPLRRLHVEDIDPDVLDSPTMLEKYLVPTHSHLSLSLHLQVEDDGSGSPDALFTLLSGKHIHENHANLPEVESLVLLGDFTIPLANLVEFVAACWNAEKKTLNTLRLKDCYIQLSPDSGYTCLSEDHGVSSAVLKAMKPFMDKGFVFEIF